MIGIANQKLWNLGVGLLSKWNRPYFFLLRVIFYREFYIYTYSIPLPPAYFFYAPHLFLSQAWAE